MRRGGENHRDTERMGRSEDDTGIEDGGEVRSQKPERRAEK